MARRLPPLNGLRGFEAAARHLSFTLAADELGVTQAAVSHQVKALEQRLGIQLFRRLNRALMLTEAGQAYLPPVRDAFDAIAQATTRLAARQAGAALTVSTMDSFAATWLVPRLGRFRAAHPGIDIRIMPSDQLVDFARDDVDLGIRYGRGHYPGLSVVRFLTEDIFPVCSPALIAGGDPLDTHADLRHHTLLHDDIGEDWRMWLMAAGVGNVDPFRGPAFGHSNLVIQAAIEGQGVALGRGALVAHDLAAGRLVRPFAISLPAEYAYYIVYRQAAAREPRLVAFRDWLLAEAERDAATP